MPQKNNIIINFRKIIQKSVFIIFIFLLLPLTGKTQVIKWFSENFEVPGANERYGFGYKYPEGHWSDTHLPTGGWNGTGASYIVMYAGRTQYGFGYVTPSLNRTFNIGEGVYMRFRIKYDENMRVYEDWGNKFIMMGRTGTIPNSRFIFYMSPPAESRGCTLAMRDWSQPGNPYYPWAIPSYFGISGFSTFEDPILEPYSWSLNPQVNISWDCAPPIFQTVPSNPFNGRPGPVNSERSIDGWYHIQVYVQSGNPGAGAFKVWVNNNNYYSPSSEKIGLVDGLGVVDWGLGVQIGGYMDNATPSTNLGYIIDDFEIGPDFDPNWYPGNIDNLPPSAPTGLVVY